MITQYFTEGHSDSQAHSAQNWDIKTHLIAAPLSHRSLAFAPHQAGLEVNYLREVAFGECVAGPDWLYV
jgi:hypothetical protein